MSVDEHTGALLIIDPGTRHPELGSAALLCREARRLGLRVSLCLPALPQHVDAASAALASLLEGPVMTLAALRRLDPRRLGGLIILGSGASPAEQLQWQDELSAWLRPLLEEPSASATPLLGICYGHQLLAQLCGSEVTRLWGGEKASGARLTALSDPRLGLSGLYTLIVSHRDGALSLPSGWRSLASERPEQERIGRPAGNVVLDPVVAIEAMSHLTAPWWGFQAHVEAEESFIEQNEVDSPLPSPYDGHEVTRAFIRRCASHVERLGSGA